MKIFGIIQMHYAILGISSSNQYSGRVLRSFILFGFSIAAHFVYMFRVADGFMELVESICATFGNIIMFVCFAAIAFKKKLLFECIDKIEKLIGTRKASLNN